MTDPQEPIKDEKIVILDRGNVELAIPRDWSVKPDPEGYMKFEDPTEECLLEVSYLRLPNLAPEAPTVEERLRFALREDPRSREAPITSFVRGETSLSWTDYLYESEDPKRGTRRTARGRWLIASNGRFQVLMTFYYWKDDAAWALRSWERIVQTLSLGDGSQLTSPFEHWSLRPPS